MGSHNISSLRKECIGMRVTIQRLLKEFQTMPGETIWNPGSLITKACSRTRQSHTADAERCKALMSSR
jgi:hypothetical protein